MDDTELIYIESDLPIPQKKRGRAKSWKYIFQTMEIGQGFLFPTSSSIRSNLYNVAKSVGIKITVNEVKDTYGIKDGTIRCIKIAGPVTPPEVIARERKVKVVKKKVNSAELISHIASCDEEECFVNDHDPWRKGKK